MVKMKKYINDIRKTCKSEVQIWKQTFLVSWILCRYGMEKCKKYRNNESLDSSAGNRPL